jgi:SH3-like domain-containing protein
MTFARVTACAAAFCAVLGASIHGAAAAPALATNNVNMRQGPGTNFPIIMTIPGGSNVDVGGCEAQWCSVSFGGQAGYAVATSFDMGGGPPGPGGPPPGPGMGPGMGPGAGPDVPVPAYPGGPPPAVVVVPPPYYGPYYDGPGWHRGYYYRRGW